MGTTVIEGVQNMAVCYKNDFELKAQIPYLPKSRLPKELKKNKQTKKPSTVINPPAGRNSSAPQPNRHYGKTILSPICSSNDPIILPKSHLFFHKCTFSFHFWVPKCTLSPPLHLLRWFICPNSKHLFESHFFVNAQIYIHMWSQSFFLAYLFLVYFWTSKTEPKNVHFLKKRG